MYTVYAIGFSNGAIDESVVQGIIKNEWSKQANSII